MARKFKFFLLPDKALNEGQYTVLIISYLFLLRMRNSLDKAVEKIKTQFYVQQRFTKIVPFMRKCGKIL